MDDILAPRFIDPVAARKHLEALRWPDGAECPHCGSYQCYRREGRAARGCISATPAVSSSPLRLARCSSVQRSRSTNGCSAITCCALQEGHERPSNPPYARRDLQNRLVHVPPYPRGHEGRDSPLGGPARPSRAMKPSLAAKKKRLSGKVAPTKKVMTLVERDGRARSFLVANLHANNIRARARHQRATARPRL